jgi:hypothetical protein
VATPSARGDPARRFETAAVGAVWCLPASLQPASEHSAILLLLLWRMLLLLLLLLLLVLRHSPPRGLKPAAAAPPVSFFPTLIILFVFIIESLISQCDPTPRRLLVRKMIFFVGLGCCWVLALLAGQSIAPPPGRSCARHSSTHHRPIGAGAFPPTQPNQIHCR